MSTPTGRSMSGKVYDPVFLCMIGAVVLAVGTSVMLRTLAGPQSAHAAENAARNSPASPDSSSDSPDNQ